MYVIALLDESGVVISSAVTATNAAALFCTPAAREELAARLDKARGRCDRCGIVARSEELHEGTCREGSGCRVEDKFASLLDAPLLTRTQMLAEYIRSAITNLIDSKGQGVKPSEPPDTEGGLLVEW